MDAKDFIRGTIRTIVLKLLSENKRMYGYEINQRVKDLSGNEIELTYGALYPILYKMEADELLTTETDLVDNRARKYYSLTPKGQEVSRQKVAELMQFTDILKTILKPSPNTEFES